MDGGKGGVLPSVSRIVGGGYLFRLLVSGAFGFGSVVGFSGSAIVASRRYLFLERPQCTLALILEYKCK